MNITHVALRNVSRNIRRSILSGAAIGVSAMAIVLLFAFISGMKLDMKTNLTTYYTGDILIRNETYKEYERYNPIHLTADEKEVREVLEGIEGVRLAVARIRFPSTFYINGGMNPAVGVGADFTREADFQDLDLILKAGRFPEKNERAMLIGAVLAENLGLELGDSVTVMSTTAARGTNAITLEIVGLAAFPVGALNTGFFWTDIDTARYFLRMYSGDSHEILLRGDTDADLDAISSTILEKLSGSDISYEVKPYYEINELYSFMVIAEYIYYVMAIIFILLGSTVIINTTMMVIFERMREIGTLSALGMKGKELTRLFFTEGLIISAISSFVGVVIGALIVTYLSRVGLNFAEAMQGVDMEVSSMLYPQFSLWTTVFVFFYSVVISSAATFIPSRKAARIEIVDALRYI
ncbi:MAG: ABC transporter permease [Sphaerochaetaceae bacterium]|nr:ABC transporter permease [Sphaerochaetaceae bacterium]